MRRWIAPPQRGLQPPRDLAEPIWLEWLALGGLLLFGAWLLGVRGVWALLLRADPTGLTWLIVAIFLGSTVWCGARARALQAQRQALHASLPPGGPGQGWAHDYWRACHGPASNADAALALLLEHSHGPHGTAWWVNGLQLKLGLLGKVIGFSILALDLGQLHELDAGPPAELLTRLTTGLGVALLSTLVGLSANIVLGLQLTRLDRYADQLVAECQRQRLPAPMARPA